MKTLTFYGVWENGNQLILGNEFETVEISSIKGGLIFFKNDFGIELPINAGYGKKTTITDSTLTITKDNMMAIYKIN